MKTDKGGKQMKRHYQNILWVLIMVMALTATFTAGPMMKTEKADSWKMILETQALPKVRTLQMNQADADKAVQQLPSAGEDLVATPTGSTYVYYYRVFNGWLQRRLWNRTLGKWAWSTWHDVKKVK